MTRVTGLVNSLAMSVADYDGNLVEAGAVAGQIAGVGHS